MRFNSRRFARLSVETMEERCVPAGMIEIREEIDLNGVKLLRIVGDNADNHIHVSPSGADMVASSSTGPIKYTTGGGTSTIFNGPVVIPPAYWSDLSTRLFVHGLNGNDTIEVIGSVWAEIQIAADYGDDHVFLNAVTGGCSIDTSNGNDVVDISNCQVQRLSITTGFQNDRVNLSGVNRFESLYVHLGAGADVLDGDTAPGSALTGIGGALPRINLAGGDGKDKITDVSYFQAAGGILSMLDFETIR